LVLTGKHKGLSVIRYYSSYIWIYIGGNPSFVSVGVSLIRTSTIATFGIEGKGIFLIRFQFVLQLLLCQFQIAISAYVGRLRNSVNTILIHIPIGFSYSTILFLPGCILSIAIGEKFRIIQKILPTYLQISHSGCNTIRFHFYSGYIPRYTSYGSGYSIILNLEDTASVKGNCDR
jgi:hypothetical protein